MFLLQPLIFTPLVLLAAHVSVLSTQTQILNWVQFCSGAAAGALFLSHPPLLPDIKLLICSLLGRQRGWVEALTQVLSPALRTPPPVLPEPGNWEQGEGRACGGAGSG